MADNPEGCRLSKEVGVGRGRKIVIENRFTQIALAPQDGGHVIGFRSKGANVEFVQPGAGLLEDRFWGASGGPNPWNGPYQITVLKEDPDEVIVRLWREQRSGDWNFHEIEKTIFLLADQSMARVRYVYKVHPDRMRASSITPWVMNSIAVSAPHHRAFVPLSTGPGTGSQGMPPTSLPSQPNKIFLPLCDGIRCADLNSEAAGEDQVFHNPARGWLAVVGTTTGDGLAVTADPSRLMAFGLLSGRQGRTLNWMYNSFSVDSGRGLESEHELIPFRGLSQVSGAGGGVSVALDAPDRVAPGQRVRIGVSVYNASPGRLRVDVGCRTLPKATALAIESRMLDIPVDGSQSFFFEWQPEHAGLAVIEGRFFRDGKAVCDFGRAVRVGETTETHVFRPSAKRLGDPAERFEPGAGAKTTGFPEFEFKEEVVTPHVKWAKPYVHGPLRVLFITDQLQGRDLIELKQRMDIDLKIALIIRNKRPFVGEHYNTISEELACAELTYRLQEKDFDVIVVGGGSLIWEAEHRKAIAELVRDGVGLVWTGAPTDKELKDILPLDVPQPKGGTPPVLWNSPSNGEHPVTRLLPLGILPATSVGTGAVAAPGTEVLATAGPDGTPLIAVRETGRGRVVHLNYTTSEVLGGPFGGVAPMDHSVVREPYRYWEYWFSLIARAIVWAGRSEAELFPVVTDVEIAARPGEPSAVAMRVDLQGSRNQFADLRIELTLRDKYGEALWAETKPWDGKPATFVCGPVGRGGRHLADLRVFSGDHIVSWGTQDFSAEGGTAIRQTRLDRPGVEDVFLGGENVEGTVLLDRPVGDCQVVAELYDGCDRLLSSQALQASPEVRISLPVARPLHAGGFLIAKVIKNGQILDLDKRFATLLPDKHARRTWDDYTGIVWGPLGSQRLWSAEARARVILSLGYDVHNCMHPATHTLSPPNDFLWTTRVGLRPLAMNLPTAHTNRTRDEATARQYTETGDKRVLVREPSLSDPAFQDLVLNRCCEIAKKLRPLRPFAYNFGDEIKFAPKGLDYDFSAHALMDLRAWLQMQYPSLQALNAEWRTDFKTWDEVMPETLDEARTSGRYAAWGDLKMFAAHCVARHHLRLVAEMKKTDPDAFYGLSGTQRPHYYNGIDWAQLSPAFNYLSVYWAGGQLPHLHADLAPDIRQAFWFGFGWRNPDATHVTWQYHLRRQAGQSFYEHYILVNPDGRPTQSGLAISGAQQHLRQGITKLWLNCKWPKDRVAMYYSMPSIVGTHVTGREDHSFDGYGWFWLLSDCGIQVKHVSYLDVRRNGISRRDFDVMVLPLALALSPEEVVAIEQFVVEGGTVLADSVPGILTEHCALRDQSPLDELFGVAHKEAHRVDAVSGQVRFSGSASGLSLGEVSATMQLATRRVRVAGGQALGKLSDTPAVIVKQHGNGRTVYMNIAMSQYYEARNKTAEKDLRELLRPILTWAGAQPAFGVSRPDGSPIERLERDRYTSGDNLYVSLLLDALEAAPARVTLPKTGHLYDMRAKTYLGEGNAFDVVLPPCDALLLALLPYRVGSVEVCATSVQPGSLGQIELSIHATAAPGLHCLRLEVFGPDGKCLEHLSQNVVAKDGHATAQVPFALNDARGEYRLVARDVASGATGEGQIAVV